MNKRLFLFAGYDVHKKVSESLLFYLGALSKIGDIVFVMDSDVSQSELQKLGAIKNILYVQTGHHGEYDFGSYKRGFLWAYKNKIIKSYDWVYFVNDSVLGPTKNIKPILSKLENYGADEIGMFYAEKQFLGVKDNILPNHVQSWFVGVKSSVAQKKYFCDFMNSICKQDNKADIIYKYEVGLTVLLQKHKCSVAAVLSQDMQHDLYRAPLWVLKHNVPFIKKSAIRFLSPDELIKYVDAKLFQCIKHDHLYKHQKYVRVKDVCVFNIRLLTLKRRTKTNKTKWFLFNCLPLI